MKVVGMVGWQVNCDNDLIIRCSDTDPA